MPKGPNGQKRPADVIGAANMVARIATGEIIETPAKPRGSAGGKARAEKLKPEHRREIVSFAAESRWRGKGKRPMQTAKQKADAAGGRDAVRMYPNNQLKEQVREFGSNLSVVDVMTQAFDDRA